MFKAMKRWWNYLGAKVNKSFNDKADPAVQLEQAIAEAQDQHRRLKEQAANVIANQKQAELRLNRSMEEYERLNANARQAIIMADAAAKAGDDKKVAEYTAAAEAFANRLLTLEGEIEESKTMVLQASQAAEQSKAAVSQNSQMLQKKLAERQRLMSQLDQAKMQEQMNTAIASLTETVGEDVPTFEQVRDKIEARYAKAKGTAELSSAGVETQMLEIEQAARNVEAQARLGQIRAQLGLEAPADADTPGGELDSGAAAELSSASTLETSDAEPAKVETPDATS
jgi:phage shock protein A